jgi:hypothetical protein
MGCAIQTDGMALAARARASVPPLEAVVRDQGQPATDDHDRAMDARLRYHSGRRADEATAIGVSVAMRIRDARVAVRTD